MSDDDLSERIKKAADLIGDVAEENSEIIDKFVSGEATSIDVGDTQPLIQAKADSEHLYVNLETNRAKANSMGVKKEGDILKVTMNGKTVDVEDVPDDIVMSEVRMSFKNSVMSIQIPRESGSKEVE